MSRSSGAESSSRRRKHTVVRSKAKDDVIVSAQTSVIMGTMANNSGFSQAFLINKLKNPPGELKSVKNQSEKNFIVTILCRLCSFTKSSTNLVHGIEDCTSYYKVFSSGFRERVTMDDLVKLYQLNRDIGWLAIRDIYIEMDTRRVVVELNKETSRPYQPPLENAMQRYGGMRMENGNGYINGSMATVGSKRRKSEINPVTMIMPPPNVALSRIYGNQLSNEERKDGGMGLKIIKTITDAFRDDDSSQEYDSNDNEMSGNEIVNKSITNQQTGRVVDSYNTDSKPQELSEEESENETNNGTFFQLKSVYGEDSSS